MLRVAMRPSTLANGADYRKMSSCKAVTLVGGNVLDVTWYLTQVVVTLDEEIMPPLDILKSSGPVIEIQERSDPIYHDPADPNPDDIWGDNAFDEVLYQHETEEEAEAARVRRNMMYATKDSDDPPDEPHVSTVP